MLPLCAQLSAFSLDRGPFALRLSESVHRGKGTKELTRGKGETAGGKVAHFWERVERAKQQLPARSLSLSLVFPPLPNGGLSSSDS